MPPKKAAETDKAKKSPRLTKKKKLELERLQEKLQQEALERENERGRQEVQSSFTARSAACQEEKEMLSRRLADEEALETARRDEINKLGLKKKLMLLQEEEWVSFLACSKLPNATKIGDMNEYISLLFESEKFEPSLEEAIESLSEVMTVFELVRKHYAAVKLSQTSPDHVTMISDLRRNLLLRIDTATANILLTPSENANASGIIYKCVRGANIGVGLWFNLAKNLRMKTVEFPTLSVTLDLPRALCHDDHVLRVILYDEGMGVDSEEDPLVSVGGNLCVELVSPFPPAVQRKEWTLRKMYLKDFDQILKFLTYPPTEEETVRGDSNLISISMPLDPKAYVGRNAADFGSPSSFSSLHCDNRLGVPRVAWFDQYLRRWSEEGISNIKVADGRVSFFSDRLRAGGIFSVVVSRFMSLPYKNWICKPLPGGRDVSLMLTLADGFNLHITSGEGVAILTHPAADPRFVDIANKPLQPDVLLASLVKRGVCITPEKIHSAAFPSIIPKRKEVEEGACLGIASIANFCAFKFSLKNCYVNDEETLFEFCRSGDEDWKTVKFLYPNKTESCSWEYVTQPAAKIQQPIFASCEIDEIKITHNLENGSCILSNLISSENLSGKSAGERNGAHVKTLMNLLSTLGVLSFTETDLYREMKMIKERLKPSRCDSVDAAETENFLNGGEAEITPLHASRFLAAAFSLGAVPPPLTSNILHNTALSHWKSVKLYLSASPTDLKWEIDYLHRFVLPALRLYCTFIQVDFSWVNVRWGSAAAKGGYPEEIIGVERILKTLGECKIPSKIGDAESIFFLALAANRRTYTPSRLSLENISSSREFEWVGGMGEGEGDIMSLEIEHARRVSAESVVSVFIRHPDFIGDPLAGKTTKKPKKKEESMRDASPEELKHYLISNSNSKEAWQTEIYKRRLFLKCSGEKLGWMNFPARYCGARDDTGVIVQGLFPFGVRLFLSLFNEIASRTALPVSTATAASPQRNFSLNILPERDIRRDTASTDPPNPDAATILPPKIDVSPAVSGGSVAVLVPPCGCVDVSGREKDCTLLVDRDEDLTVIATSFAKKTKTNLVSLCGAYGSGLTSLAALLHSHLQTKLPSAVLPVLLIRTRNEPFFILIEKLTHTLEKFLDSELTATGPVGSYPPDRWASLKAVQTGMDLLNEVLRRVVNNICRKQSLFLVVIIDGLNKSERRILANLFVKEAFFEFSRFVTTIGFLSPPILRETRDGIDELCVGPPSPDIASFILTEFLTREGVTDWPEESHNILIGKDHGKFPKFIHTAAWEVLERLKIEPADTEAKKSVDEILTSLPQTLPDLYQSTLERLEQSYGSPFIRTMRWLALSNIGLLFHEIVQLIHATASPALSYCDCLALADEISKFLSTSTGTPLTPKEPRVFMLQYGCLRDVVMSRYQLISSDSSGTSTTSTYQRTAAELTALFKHICDPIPLPPLPPLYTNHNLRTISALPSFALFSEDWDLLYSLLVSPTFLELHIRATTAAQTAYELQCVCISAESRIDASAFRGIKGVSDIVATNASTLATDPQNIYSLLLGADAPEVRHGVNQMVEGILFASNLIEKTLARPSDKKMSATNMIHLSRAVQGLAECSARGVLRLLPSEIGKIERRLTEGALLHSRVTALLDPSFGFNSECLATPHPIDTLEIKDLTRLLLLQDAQPYGGKLVAKCLNILFGNTAKELVNVRSADRISEQQYEEAKRDLLAMGKDGWKAIKALEPPHPPCLEILSQIICLLFKIAPVMKGKREPKIPCYWKALRKTSDIRDLWFNSQGELNVLIQLMEVNLSGDDWAQLNTLMASINSLISEADTVAPSLTIIARVIKCCWPKIVAGPYAAYRERFVDNLKDLDEVHEFVKMVSDWGSLKPLLDFGPSSLSHGTFTRLSAIVSSPYIHPRRLAAVSTTFGTLAQWLVELVQQYLGIPAAPRPLRPVPPSTPAGSISSRELLGTPREKRRKAKKK